MTDLRPILDALSGFFESDGWSVDPVPGQSSLRMQFRGKSGTWACYAQARERDRQFLFYSVCPVSVPEARRAAVAEYLTRANYGLLIGNFEMDLADGEVRCKTGMDVERTELTDDLVRPAVYANVVTMDKYLPGISSVVYGDASPVEAIAEIDGP